jgi:conjugative transfer pilus assembly protein TraH
MNRIRLIFIAGLLSAAFGASLSAIAGSNLDSALNSMFMSNITPPQGFNGSLGRGGFTGGMAAIRTGVKPINLAYLDPPRITAGCGGIDAFGGSFSFINLQQITQLFRNIVANAGGALFYLATQSISPIISDTMSRFQKDIQDMNASLGNTCALANMAINTFAPDAQANTAGTLGGLGSSLWGSATDMFQGFFAGGSTQNAQANQNSTAAANPGLNNLTWKAIASSNRDQMIGDPTGILTSDVQASKEIVMSLLGTVIVNPSAASPDGNATPAAEGGLSGGVNVGSGTGTQAADSSAQWVATLRLHDLIEGAGSSNNPTNTQVLHCTDAVPGNVDPPTGCLQIMYSPFTFQGTANLTKQMLYGTGGSSDAWQPDGILSLIQNCTVPGCGMTTQQQSFLYSIDTPLYNMIRDTQVDWSSVPGLVKRLEPAIAYSVAIKLARSVERMARTTWTGGASSAANMPPFISATISSLGAELNSMEKENSDLQQSIDNARAYANEIIKMNPGAIALHR